MFGWFRKRREPVPEQPLERTNAPIRRGPIDLALRAGIDTIVAVLQVDPNATDETIIQCLTESGLSNLQATKLVQFVPIAFTRFLYRGSGVQFDPHYFVLGPDRQRSAPRLIADEPAFVESWNYCEEAACNGADNNSFVGVAARSGGYRLIQDFSQQGLNLAGIITSSPIVMGERRTMRFT